MKRPVYLALGTVAVALGVLGAFLPVLPTVPFMLVAAWCFGKAHPAWEARLLAHPVYGEHIRNWRQRGAIPLRAKQASAAMMAISAVVAAFVLQGWMRFAPGAVMLAVGLWIWTRPSK